MDIKSIVGVALLICSFFLRKIVAVELTFELADNAKECFYQDITKDTAATLEFQVLPHSELTIPSKFL